jgi:hypothetical protein
MQNCQPCILMRLDSVIINSEFKTSIYVCSFIHSVIYKNENGIIVLVSLVISFSLCSAACQYTCRSLENQLSYQLSLKALTLA